jgi:virginiamycin B lyase
MTEIASRAPASPAATPRAPTPLAGRLARLVAVAALVVGCSSTTPTAAPGSIVVPPSATPDPATSPGTTAPGATVPSAAPGPPATVNMSTFDVPAGSHPHDVAPAADGGIWFTAQASGELGWLDPATREVLVIDLGTGSSPHGVIVGPDDAAWVTDSGLNAIVRVDGTSHAVTTFPLDVDGANLNTATFGGDGVLWFTGQSGVYGRFDPAVGHVETFEAPKGRGPYGIATTPDGEVYLGSLAGSYLGAIDRATGSVTVIDTPTAGGGARRVWSDSAGRPWITEWFAGRIARYDPPSAAWEEWDLPGEAQPYAVYVDEVDGVWITDFGANAIHRFDPPTDTFLTLTHDSQPAEVRQLLGRPGEVWGAESAADRLVVVQFGG